MGNSNTKSLSAEPSSSGVVRQFHNSVMVGMTDGSVPHVAPPAAMKPRPFIVNVLANDFFGIQSNNNNDNNQNNHVVLIKAARLSTYFLDLSHLNLSDLCGSSMRQAHHLRGLQLSFNKLSSLPLEMGMIHNLCFLDLSSNQLTSLPDTLSDLTCLIELKMARNLLSSLPLDLFTKLTKLETLDLSHNQFAALPQKISELSSLSALHLDGNPLSSVPYELGQLKFLRTLTLEGCPLLEDLPENLAAIMESAASTPTSESSPSSSSSSSSAKTTQTRLPSLKELAARVLVRHSVPVPSKSIPDEIAGYLKTAQTCTFCQGPFFEFHVKRYRFVFRGGVNLPLESRLCSVHWTNEKERILAMFRPPPSTSPKALDAHKLQLIESRNSRQASSRRSIAVSISSTDLGPKSTRKANLLTRAGNMMKGKSPNTMTAASEHALSLSASSKHHPAAEGSPSSDRNPSQRPDSPMEIEDDRIRTMKASNSSLF